MKRNPFTLIARLLSLVKPMLPILAGAVLLGVAGFLSAIAIPVLGGFTLIRAASHQPIVAFLLILIACGLLRGLLRYAEQYLNHYVAFRLLAIIRDRVFRTLRRLAPAKLEDRGKGDLISIITTDIELLEVFYAHTISPIAIAFSVSVIMVIFIGQYHALLGVVATVGYLTVGIILPLIISKTSGKTGMEYRKEFGALNGFVLESLRGLKETIQFGIGKERLSDINSRTEKLDEKARKMKTLEGLTFSISGALILIFAFVILTVGSLLNRQGAVSADGVLISTIAMISSFGPVIALANLSNNLTHTFASGNRVLDILDEAPETLDVENEKNISFTGADCKNVCFAYEKEAILSDFSMNFKQNKIIGITGKSGSGKSTLLRLLMRFWDVKSGNISISGENIGSVNTANLRDLESFVTQDTQLFSDTIENNIKIARAGATRTEVEEACKKAAIHDFVISLPKGYDTNLGELGDGLSGGERQRIGLARAFLHDAPLMLLDEPTSNLDSLNEAVILTSLRNSCENKIVVLVSHRASTMGVADEVHMIENGRTS